MNGAGAGAAIRENLLGFIGQRLRVMRGVQLKEHQEFKRVRQWFRQIARGVDGYHLPNPTRWHQAAHYFKEAAEAMCHGNLARGAQLLERAIGAERAAWDTIPNMVRDNLEALEKSPGAYPSELPHALEEVPLPPCAIPEDVAFADEILSLRDEFFESPPLRGRRRRPGWWEDEEEEEKKDDKKEGADGKGKEAEPEEEEEEEEARDEGEDLPTVELGAPEKDEAGPPDPAPPADPPAAPGRRRGRAR